jgi:hypothetical protein
VSIVFELDLFVVVIILDLFKCKLVANDIVADDVDNDDAADAFLCVIEFASASCFIVFSKTKKFQKKVFSVERKLDFCLFERNEKLLGTLTKNFKKNFFFLFSFL